MFRLGCSLVCLGLVWLISLFEKIEKIPAGKKQYGKRPSGEKT